MKSAPMNTTSDPITVNLFSLIDASIANAIREAEERGYQRALVEGVVVTQDQDSVREVLGWILRDLEEANEALESDPLDSVHVSASVDTVEIPDDSSSLSDVAEFLSEHGGRELAPLDEVDVEEARQVLNRASARIEAALNRVRAALRR